MIGLEDPINLIWCGARKHNLDPYYRMDGLGITQIQGTLGLRFVHGILEKGEESNNRVGLFKREING